MCEQLARPQRDKGCTGSRKDRADHVAGRRAVAESPRRVFGHLLIKLVGAHSEGGVVAGRLGIKADTRDKTDHTHSGQHATRHDERAARRRRGRWGRGRRGRRLVRVHSRIGGGRLRANEGPRLVQVVRELGLDRRVGLGLGLLEALVVGDRLFGPPELLQRAPDIYQQQRHLAGRVGGLKLAQGLLVILLAVVIDGLVVVLFAALVFDAGVVGQSQRLWRKRGQAQR